MKYVTVAELIAWLESLNAPEYNVKVEGALLTDMYFHEITGPVLTTTVRHD